MTECPLFSIEYHILIAAFELFTLAESFLPISRLSAQMHYTPDSNDSLLCGVIDAVWKSVNQIFSTRITVSDMGRDEEVMGGE
jgi:hypothetical protein